VLENLFPNTKHFEDRGKKELLKKFRQPLQSLSEYDSVYEIIKGNLFSGTGRAVQVS
jgi:hypothetical protein